MKSPGWLDVYWVNDELTEILYLLRKPELWNMQKIEFPQWLFKGRPKHGKLESTVLESVADGLDWLFYIIDYSDVGFQFLAYFFNPFRK